MGLVEHKLPNDNISKFIIFLNDDWEVIHNNDLDNRGKIMLLWNKSIWLVNTVTMLDRHIRCSLTNKGGMNCNFISSMR